MALLSDKEYQKLYLTSISKPTSFWENMAKKHLIWFKKWNKVFSQKNNVAKWFDGAKINISFNCLDRHIKNGGGSKIAYIWTNEKGEEIKITYQELLKKVNKIGNLLLANGVSKKDVITIYMPQTIEAVAVMLACSRLGVIHNVVYAGFGYEALKARIQAAGSHLVITADFTYRRGKAIDLLSIVRNAITKTPVKQVIVFKRQSKTRLLTNEIDLLPNVNIMSAKLKAQEVDSENPLFTLYTSGTTGKPKGILHTTAGYNLFTHITTKFTFNTNEKSIFWCTADIGWITGHSYVVYGPLSNHLTSILYEGALDFPTNDIWWKIIKKYKVNIFYTAPTAIRMLMAQITKKLEYSNMNVIGSVGEPLNVAAWYWYSKNVGQGCPLVDTWWQTETGGHMITTLPGLTQKPGFAGLPYFGIEAKIVDEHGKEKQIGKKGLLVIKGFWPGMLRMCWKDKIRFNNYFSKIKGYFFTGDFAVKDNDGYIRILGRSDDTINSAGHTISSAEVENILCNYKNVMESAVVGIPDAIKGERIIAFVVIKKLSRNKKKLEKDIIRFVESTYGKFARPSEIRFIDKLPKTRSGKIVRRILKAQILEREVGDTSTLE